MAPTPPSVYDQRVNRVLDYIRAHKDEVLTLEALADVAAFSRFHFHRVFRAVTGENLMEHIQRVRLEGAATALVTRPHAAILAIALDHGFSSASVFARAFKDRFGMSASDWRKSPERRRRYLEERNPRQLDRNLGKAGATEPGQAHLTPDPQRADGRSTACDLHAPSPEIPPEVPMSVIVETLPRYRVAYLRNIGPYGPAGGINATWQRLARWATSRDLWTPDRVGLGVCHDNPAVTAPELCRYDAALVIAPGLVVDGDVSVADVDGGKYAVAHFEGPAEAIGEPFDRVFHWLRDSGYEPDDRLMFERYQGEPYDPARGVFICDVCVPIRPLRS